MAEKTTFGIGLIGAGGFGLFCMEAFNRLEGVRIAAAADIRREMAEMIATRFEPAKAYTDAAKLIASSDVDIVHVATPPSSHHDLVLQALKAGKHVLCEKPLAMSLAQADEMVAAARQAQRICPVNFVMRYNAVTEAVKAILRDGLLGRPLSARLTNCASDSKLGPDHWFWDLEQSGGIFIEHGVHFFDLYRYWFGTGQVISAHTETRPDTTQQDRVTCEIRHDNGVVASHYHGFDQLGPLDRTSHRIVCERGDLIIDGWIPLTLTVEGVVDEAAERALMDVCPGGSLATLEEFSGDRRTVHGRGQTHTVDRLVRLRWTPAPDKQAVYAESVRRLMADQVRFLRDKAHQRVVGEENGRNSVETAETAAKMAAEC